MTTLNNKLKNHIIEEVYINCSKFIIKSKVIIKVICGIIVKIGLFQLYPIETSKRNVFEDEHDKY